MTSVLVTRPLAQAKVFAGELKNAGFKTYIAPMLEYKNIEIDLSNIEKFDSLIFTSSQAIKYFCDICPLRDFLVFTIGDSSAETANKYNFKNINSARGNFKNLIKLIADNAKKKLIKDILYICGEDITHDISQDLAQFNINIIKKIIYKAEYKEILAKEIIKAFSNKDIDIITLFSVRSAKNLLKLIKTNNLIDYLIGVKIVSLSDKIANEIKSFHCKDILIADEPNRTSMLKKIKN